MKLRRSLVLLLLTCVVLVGVALWFSEKPKREIPPALPEAAGLRPTSGETRPADAKSEGSPAFSSNATGAASLSQATPGPAQAKLGLAALNDEAIVFYGKALDQFGAPVVGATVAGSIQVNNGSRVGADKLSLTTDSSGFFAISGYRGKALGINISKPGYVMATSKTRFVYSLLWPQAERYTPDRENPTMVKMWKLQGAEPLLSLDKTYRLPFTDRPVHLDLIAGQTVLTGGDLKLTVHRPPGAISEQHPQDWSVTVEVIDGGLIEAPDSDWGTTFLAPADGYQPSGDFARNNGITSLSKALFVKSRGGRVYSKLGLSFRVNSNPGGFMYLTLAGAANTNGSQNWEATIPQ